MVQQRDGVPRVPAFDGSFSAEDHRGRSSSLSIGKSKPAAASSDEKLPGLVELAGVSVGHGLRRVHRLLGNVRSIGVHLVHQRGQVDHSPALPGDRQEVPSVDNGGVRLAAVSADLERLVGQLLGLVGVAGGQ